MNGVWGAGLLTATVLLLSWAYGAYRRPDPSAWTQSEAIATAIALVITMGLGFATASLVAFSGDLWRILSVLEAPDYILIGMGIAFGAYVVWRLATPDLTAEDSPEKQEVSITPFDGRPKTPSGKLPASRTARMKRAA